MKILVLGVTGMLGRAAYQVFQETGDYEVWGTLRHSRNLEHFPKQTHSRLICDLDILNQDFLLGVFEQVQPELIINCVGLIKQYSTANDPLIVLPINSLFPHRLAKLCAVTDARLIHVSTDCVFSGSKGDYREDDLSDALDLYGKSKFIGELSDYPHAITVRTSLIGHELSSNRSLIDWFLAQKEQVYGYKNAVFSGFPVVELARIMRDYIAPNKELVGLYHVAANPINKYDLLTLVSEIYGKQIKIIPEENMVIDRSLNAARFNAKTGYTPPKWPKLVETMHQSWKDWNA
ncbi:dTDP-4-dehydrorhamnose reductase family protein [Legionella hackeliae]|uniref:dTDP-4-dehydrorhamnose reductase n=1 Tax=Legionella hackeliae TaxID=449 RepID=A0A0A8UU00_LEGHA|nr:SDR family oxidoreductase [Legionella hackeliae]KTD08811.1 dTDP-4-dehydrorhamnose reductase [Legionella hackeliae]CEK10239.1 dTDP-4-dehydrorhamnose reductase [Legionella hackeliae]STX46968.1 dTDP-4-dehydrorhamnose reductase [Legionella hackeliae]